MSSAPNAITGEHTFQPDYMFPEGSTIAQLNAVTHTYTPKPELIPEIEKKPTYAVRFDENTFPGLTIEKFQHEISEHNARIARLKAFEEKRNVPFGWRTKYSGSISILGILKDPESGKLLAGFRTDQEDDIPAADKDFIQGIFNKYELAPPKIVTEPEVIKRNIVRRLLDKILQFDRK